MSQTTRDPAMTTPRSETMGEAVDRQGVPEIFALIVSLAEADGRIPVGPWWVRDLVDGWTLRVNSQKETHEGVPPYHALIEHGSSLAMALVSPAGGTLLGCDEDTLVDVLRRTVAQTKASHERPSLP